MRGLKKKSFFFSLSSSLSSQRRLQLELEQSRVGSLLPDQLRDVLEAWMLGRGDELKEQRLGRGEPAAELFEALKGDEAVARAARRHACIHRNTQTQTDSGRLLRWCAFGDEAVKVLSLLATFDHPNFTSEKQKTSRLSVAASRVFESKR